MADVSLEDGDDVDDGPDPDDDDFDGPDLPPDPDPDPEELGEEGAPGGEPGYKALGFET